ncbi:MAG TPA: phage tail protein [Gaiellaceae bacterium]|nr:phage tail protein [Gaiellaceae bacterium]
MLVTNRSTADIYFGPLHLGAGVGTQLTVDDTSATSLYLTSDAVADALNNAYKNGQITVSGAADPFPRPTGDPMLLHGSGDPEGLVYAPQGSVYMRRDGVQTNGGVLYMKTTGVTYSTGWLDLATASGATAVLPPGLIASFGGTTAPTGWLICDGSAISRTTYSLLFAAIGTDYGAGDGSTTFNLPDLRGRVPVGYAASGGHGDVSTLGANEGVALAYRRPKHQTSKSDPGHYHGSVYQSSGDGEGLVSSYGSGMAGNTASATTGIAIGTGVSTDPADTPAYLVVNQIIKT